jgi:hypothetical protein
MTPESGTNSTRSHQDHALARLTRALLFEDASRGSLNLAAVARESGVSRSFLYQNEQARALIDRARVRGGELQDSRSSTEIANWKQRAQNAEVRVRELSELVTSLRQQMQTLLGESNRAPLVPGAAELDAARSAERSRAELIRSTEICNELRDQLEASRDNVRYLNGRLAELEVKELGRLERFSSPSQDS